MAQGELDRARYALDEDGDGMGIGKEMGTHCEDECRCWWPRDNNRARCECR